MHALIKHHFIAATDHMRHWEHGTNKLPHCQVTQTFNLERPRSSTKHSAGGGGDGIERAGTTRLVAYVTKKKKKGWFNLHVLDWAHFHIFPLAFQCGLGKKQILRNWKRTERGGTRVPLTPGWGRRKQVVLYEFEASLVCIESSLTVRSAQQNYASKTNKPQQ